MRADAQLKAPQKWLGHSTPAGYCPWNTTKGPALPTLRKPFISLVSIESSIAASTKPVQTLPKQLFTMTQYDPVPESDMSADYRAAEAIIDACNHEDLRLFNAPARLDHQISTKDLVEKFTLAKSINLNESRKLSPQKWQAGDRIREWLQKLSKTQPQDLRKEDDRSKTREK